MSDAVLYEYEFEHVLYRLFPGDDFSKEKPEYIIMRFVPTVARWEIATVLVLEEGALIRSLLPHLDKCPICDLPSESGPCEACHREQAVWLKSKPLRDFVDRVASIAKSDDVSEEMTYPTWDNGDLQKMIVGVIEEARVLNGAVPA